MSKSEIFPNKNEPDLARCDTVGILGTAAGLAGILSAQKTINFFMKFNNQNNLLRLIDCKILSINHIKIETKWFQKVPETFTDTIYDNRNTPNRICIHLSNINS